MMSKDFWVLGEILYCTSGVGPVMEVQPPLLILRLSYFTTLPLLGTYSICPTHACE